MFKKGISSLLAISLLGIGGTAALADQPAYSLQNSNTNNVVSHFNIGTAGYATSSKYRGAGTSGPATLSQSDQTALNFGGTTVQQNTDQFTSVEEPSAVAQAQVNHIAAVDVSVSIPGGPTIQHQNAQAFSGQYQLALKRGTLGTSQPVLK